MLSKTPRADVWTDPKQDPQAIVPEALSSRPLEAAAVLLEERIALIEDLAKQVRFEDLGYYAGP